MKPESWFHPDIEGLECRTKEFGCPLVGLPVGITPSPLTLLRPFPAG